MLFVDNERHHISMIYHSQLFSEVYSPFCSENPCIHLILGRTYNSRSNLRSAENISGPVFEPQEMKMMSEEHNPFQ